LTRPTSRRAHRVGRPAGRQPARLREPACLRRARCAGPCHDHPGRRSLGRFLKQAATWRPPS
jgi:hypothetical protein